ncbi:MAG: hypothetical protein JNL74_12615 [Fibrobacteres bacterium]|nr:hypothetical protein [Fibrobacterota bacterium]
MILKYFGSILLIISISVIGAIKLEINPDSSFKTNELMNTNTWLAQETLTVLGPKGVTIGVTNKEDGKINIWHTLKNGPRYVVLSPGKNCIYVKFWDKTIYVGYVLADWVAPVSEFLINGISAINDTVYVKIGSEAHCSALDFMSGLENMFLRVDGRKISGNSLEFSNEGTFEIIYGASDSAKNVFTQKVFVKVIREVNEEYKEFIRKKFNRVDSMSFTSDLKMSKIAGDLKDIKGWSGKQIEQFYKNNSFIFGFPKGLEFSFHDHMASINDLFTANESIYYNGLPVVNGHIQAVIKNERLLSLHVNSFFGLNKINECKIIDTSLSGFKKFKEIGGTLDSLVVVLGFDTVKAFRGYKLSKFEGRDIVVRVYDPVEDMVKFKTTDRVIFDGGDTKRLREFMKR